MKTAISIPDNLFVSAERVSKQLGIPRSQLFAWALEEFLSKHSKDKILQKLNEVYDKEDSNIENELLHAQMKAINNNDTAW
ncbi:MAG: ChpI protein [Spirochaetales bacterium]|jgi:metal-responsive CopG/Arc/MetJ family transcriptional regulator|nr:ChpI protein [Spirochaetales bacterium]